MSSRTEAVDRLVRRVVARAASLDERGRTRGVVPIRTPVAVVDRRLEQWRRVTAKDPGQFSAMCGARAIDDPRDWVVDVAIASDDALPTWALALRRFLLAPTGLTTDDDRAMIARQSESGILFLTGTTPVPLVQGSGTDALAPAIGELRRALGRRDARSRALTEGLASHFAGLLLSTFASIVLGNGFPEGPDALAIWGEVLGEYPAAGRCLGCVLEGYLGFATELCERFDDDSSAIASLVGGPRGGEARAVGCQPGAGDRHAGLRSVTIVGLSNGSRVVYKPRDLHHVELLEGVLRAAGIDARLPERIVRDRYGWESFVEAREPLDERDRVRLAREFGTWASVFDALGAHDILSENLRLARDRLVPVDVEALFKFFFVDPSDLPWQPPATAVGMFSLPVLQEAPTKARDVGALGGKGAGLLDYGDEVVRGYREASSRLGARREAVLAVLDDAGDTPVRAILRATWVYDRLINESLRADALVDGVTRDLALERVWVANVQAECPAELVEAEVRAMRRLDVPLFTYAPRGRDLVVPCSSAAERSAQIAGVLFEPPLARARARVLALETQPHPAELDAVRAVMFCAASNRPFAGGSGASASSPSVSPSMWSGRAERSAAAVTQPDWEGRAAAAALESASWLCSGGPRGSPLVTGLFYVARNDAMVLPAALPLELLSGVAGIAIALSSLARRFGDDVVLEAAGLAGARAEAAAVTLVDDLSRRAERGWSVPSMGAYESLPALVALASSTGRGQSVLARSAGVLGYVLRDEALTGPRAVEALGGLVASMGAAPRRLPDGLEAERSSAIAALRSRAGDTPASPRFSSWLGTLVPSERALARWALSLVGEPVGSSHERPPPTGAGSGDRLVAAALDPSGLEATLESDLGALDTAHLLAELEVSLVAARADERFLESARAAGRILLARRDADGRWFGDGLCPDRFRPSATFGTVAVAHLIAGVAEPEQFYSIRLHEPIGSGT